MEVRVMLGKYEYGKTSIAKCAAGHVVNVPLDAEARDFNGPEDFPLLQLIVTMPTEPVGSVSILQKTILDAPKTVNQWITLFDTCDDDEYDGDLGGEADSEEPTIRVRFHVKETKEEVIEIVRQEITTQAHQEPTSSDEEEVVPVPAMEHTP